MRADETVHSEGSCVDDSPTYRVNFWESSGRESWNLEAFVLSGARDLQEVLNWIESNENGRRVELFVELDDEPFTSFGTPRKSDLVRLQGIDPNEDEAKSAFVVVPE